MNKIILRGIEPAQEEELKKLLKQVYYNIKDIAIAGGVSANNGLRNAMFDAQKRYNWNVFIPKFSFI